MNYKNYKKAYYPVPIKKRSWPEKELTKAPIWCSVDLRDGNQALVTPMSLEEKLGYFDMLVRMGFKEIEVAFPAASETDFEFVRTLIEKNLIPKDVTISVLTQSRPHLIEKTLASVKGAKNAIVHIYNSTSALQRKVVFKAGREEVKALALSGVKQIKTLSRGMEGLRLEYSPETFVGTEMDFAAEVCNAVIDEWGPTAENKIIINLPSTVEVSTPNVYADQIEYMNENLKMRENVVLSVHTHNDRGCAVAASELALLAGADRVEGTIFGNGERTGNADILVMALNLFSQGIDPGLQINNIEEIIKTYETYTGLPVHPRHPYAGELVYTAFSGSHQDAIKKSMDYFAKAGAAHWENPYLPINPADLGRHYEPIRINSQSGKGGISFILEKSYGLTVPKQLLQQFSQKITDISDKEQRELSGSELHALFAENYLDLAGRVSLGGYKLDMENGITSIRAQVVFDNAPLEITGQGNGPLDAMSAAIKTALGISFEIANYHQHALEQGSKSRAIAYICIKNGDFKDVWGAAIDANINTASIKALLCAVNKAL